MWFSFLRHRISSYRKSCRIWYQGDKQRFCCFSSFLSSSAVCPFIHLPSKAGPTLSFFFLFMFAKSEEQSIAPEHQKHFKILLPKIDRVLGYTHSGPFFSSCQRSRRGSLTLQMMWEDVTAGYRQGWLHSPALLPPPQKGGHSGVRPHGASCDNSSQRTEPRVSCSPGPETPAVLPPALIFKARREMRCLDVSAQSWWWPDTS